MPGNTPNPRGGSPVWTRTKNRPINSRELCQLSYGGMFAGFPENAAEPYQPGLTASGLVMQLPARGLELEQRCECCGVGLWLSHGIEPLQLAFELDNLAASV